MFDCHNNFNKDKNVCSVCQRTYKETGSMMTQFFVNPKKINGEYTGKPDETFVICDPCFVKKIKMIGIF